MQSYSATHIPKIVPIVRFRLATILAWTLLAIVIAIWECNDSMAFKVFIVQSLAHVHGGADIATLKAELEQMIVQNNVIHVAVIAVIWLMGLGLIRFGFRRLGIAATALKTERDNLNAIFETIPMPMLLFDDRLEAVSINAALREYCVDYNTLADMRCGTILKCSNAFVEPSGCGNSPACDACRLMRALREVTRSGLSSHGEASFLRSEEDGGTTEITLLYGVEAVLLNGKNHAVMSFMDITGRKLVEKRLVASEHEFRSLTETLPDNIARYDRDCRILYVNPALEKTLGMPLEKIVGKIPTELQSSIQFDEYEARLRNVLVSGVDSEMDIFRPDDAGGALHHRIQMVAERDHEGSISGALAIGHNITELKRLQKELEAHERQFRTLVENSPDSIARYDQLCRRLYVNPAMERLAGQPAAHLVGKTPVEVAVATPEVGRQVQDAVEQVLHQGLPVDIGLEWKNSGGETCHFLSRYVPELDANSEVTSVISITRDITTLRAAEAQLQHAQKMESVGLLAGGVAHDFNNILSVISGYAELLKLTITGNEEELSYVREISNSVIRGAELTRSLLAFSGKHEPQKQYDSLNQIVANLQKSMSRLLHADITLSFELCDDQLSVFADRGQIEQVVINLMVNARDAIRSGGTIQVTTARVEVDTDVKVGGAMLPAGNYGLITVADNGIGIDAEMVGRIFDPFFTTKDAGKGTGLGLAIVFGIVANHEGHITVESTPGSGSMFSIYLPVYNGEVQSKQVAKMENRELGGSETVLLVDDEPNLLLMAGTLLERYGYRVLTAADGAEALQVFEAHSDEIRIVITDMVMPRMNGRETIRRIRQQMPGLPAILISGYIDIVLDDADIHFLPKPVYFKKLMEILRAALARASSVKDTNSFAGEDFMLQPDLFQALPLFSESILKGETV